MSDLPTNEKRPKATLQSKDLIKPKVEWGYHPDSTVQENPYPAGTSMHAHWDCTKAQHDTAQMLNTISKRWTYEVTATVTVELDAQAELDRRDGDENAIREKAIEMLSIDPPAFHETSVTGWWPTDA